MFGNNNKNPLTHLREMFANPDENTQANNDNQYPIDTQGQSDDTTEETSDIIDESTDIIEETVDTTDGPADTTEEPSDTTTESTQLKDVANQYLTSSNMFLLIWFLAIYIVVYYVLGTFFNKGREPAEFQQNLGRTLDFIFFVSVFIFAVSYYTSKSKQQITDDMIVLYDNILLFLEDSNNLVAIPLFIVSLYIVVYLFRLPMSSIYLLVPFCHCREHLTPKTCNSQGHYTVIV